MTTFPVPSDPRWVIYMEGKRPTGNVGHQCAWYKVSEPKENVLNYYLISRFFYLSGDTIIWKTTKCEICGEEMPKDLKGTLKFILL